MLNLVTRSLQSARGASQAMARAASGFASSWSIPTPPNAFSQGNKGPIIDMRSDTVTRPDAEQMCAIMDAAIGDDVYGEDPSVNALEQAGAKALGKASAVYLPTGTMANLIGLAALRCVRHPQFGTAVLLGSESHIWHYEQLGVSSIVGMGAYPVQNTASGDIELDDAQTWCRGDDGHYATPGILALENSHNRCGGAVLSPARLAEIGAWATSQGLSMHCDGARLLNAAASLDVPVTDLTEPFHTVTLCLSKGVGAPVGSLLAGDADVVAQARRLKKVLGGGWRQAGLMAAAAHTALISAATRVRQDNDNAERFAERLARVPGVLLDPDAVATNIVYFDLDPATGVSAEQLVQACEAQGLRIGQYGTHRVRAVTHYQVSPDQARKAADTIKACMAELAK